MSSLLQYAQNECCNWRGGKCIGVSWDKAGNPIACRKEDSPCDPETCGHFNRCVLPGIAGSGGNAKLKAAAGLAVRECPDCGKVLGKRQRYCQECKAKRRRDAYYRQNSRRNVEDTTVKQNCGLTEQGVVTTNLPPSTNCTHAEVNCGTDGKTGLFSEGE